MRLGPAPWDRACLTTWVTTLNLIAVWWNGKSVKIISQKNCAFASRPLRLLKVIGTDTDGSGTYEFLWTFIIFTLLLHLKGLPQAFILFLSSAIKAGSIHVILDMIKPMNSSYKAWTFIPCDFRCDNKYRRWFICWSIRSTYTEVKRVSVITNPSSVACVTRSMSDKGGGILRCLEAGRWKPISLVLSELMVSRLKGHLSYLSYLICFPVLLLLK